MRFMLFVIFNSLICAPQKFLNQQFDLFIFTIFKIYLDTFAQRVAFGGL